MSAPPLRVLIVDDEPLAIERLTMLCVARPDVAVLGTAHDGEGALDAIDTLAPDLLLLDIAMPDLSGIEVARAVERLPRRPAVVFCTAFDQHALAAFEVAAVDYLLKPVTADRLTRALARARDVRPAALASAAPAVWLDELWVPHRSEMIRLALVDVDRIEAERDYVRLHVRERSFLLQHTLAALEARLDPERFVRLHRSASVRREAIARLRHEGLGVWTAGLADGSEQRVSRSCLPAAKRLLGGR